MNRHYKLHPEGPYLKAPKIILQALEQERYCLYEISEIDGYFPMPYYKLHTLEKRGIDYRKLSFKKYGEGFLAGYHSNIIPSFGDEHTKKGVIIKEIMQDLMAFSVTTRIKEKRSEVTQETIYENGFFEGRRYKAWEIVLDTPNEFIDFFEALNQKANAGSMNSVMKDYNDIEIGKLLKTINEEFEPFKQSFNTIEDYNKAIQLVHDFLIGNPQKLNEPLFVKSGNIKKLAFALGEIWRSRFNDVITYDYLIFYTRTFSIFKDQKVNKSNLFGDNLYKYSISRT